MIPRGTFALSILMTAAVMGCRDGGTAPPPPAQMPDNDPVSFQNNIRPILVARGCDGCHGGNGGLYVQTVAQLLQGGTHGPAVVPGNAAGSNLVRKLLDPPPFGDRMPQGGPYLPDSVIQVIRDWVNQGALDN